METRGFLAMRPGRVPGWKHVRSVHDLGMLRVPSGRLEASDPFIMLGSGLVFRIPPGTYPVKVTVADVIDVVETRLRQGLDGTLASPVPQERTPAPPPAAGVNWRLDPQLAGPATR